MENGLKRLPFFHQPRLMSNTPFPPHTHMSTAGILQMLSRGDTNTYRQKKKHENMHVTAFLWCWILSHVLTHTGAHQAIRSVEDSEQKGMRPELRLLVQGHSQMNSGYCDIFIPVISTAKISGCALNSAKPGLKLTAYWMLKLTVNIDTNFCGVITFSEFLSLPPE